MMKAFSAASTLTGTYLTRVTLLLDPVEIVFHEASPVDNGTDDESSNDEPETSGNTTMSFAHQVTWHWNKRKQHIEHEYSGHCA